ncbi:MAG: four-carbon acid sugar kinase family protein [Caldilineaceae bacterium]
MNSFSSLLILADDITGAADCAARCKQAGLPATILVGTPPRTLPAGAVSFSSDSRFLPPSAAAASVQRLFMRVQTEGGVHPPITWYKKIDSTLRGNIGAELAALLAVAPAASCAVVSPAFPAQGRGLVDGYLVYDQAPAQSAHLPSLIRQQTDLPQALIPLSAVRAGVAQLAATLTAHAAAGIQIFVADAVEADLAAIYTATRQPAPRLLLWQRQLVGVIATALVAAQADRAPAAPPTSLQIAHPLVAVVGSGSRMAHRQLAQLRLQTAVEWYMVDPQQPDGGLSARAGRGGDLVIHLPSPAENANLEGEMARHYAALLAREAYHQIQQRHPQTLLLVGGDTSIHLLQLLGIQTLTVEAEVLPGMPLTIGQSTDGQRYQVILKAGNHGDDQTLVTLLAL